MSRNVSLLNSVFASNAETDVPISPAVGIPYRNPNLTSGDAGQGWPFSTVVDSADFNELMFRVTGLLDFVEKTGGIIWSSLTDYAIGAFVRDEQLVFWEATNPSGPNNGGSQNPYIGSQYWKKVGQIGMNNAGGKALGEYFAYPGVTPPEGAYLLNGQTIANCSTLYPDFWEWVNNSGVRSIDNNTYETELAAAGVCGGFVIDTSAGSVRLPSLTQGTLWGADSATIGQSLAAGLPNHSHLIEGTAKHGFDGINPQGVAYFSNGDSDNYAVSKRTNEVDSSSIYGNSNTVQPPAIRVMVCIQVFNAATALSTQQSAQLASEMQLKARIDLANVSNNIDFVVDTWSASDGSSWYRKYRSGWIEQGGSVNLDRNGVATVTLPIEMQSTDYHLNCCYGARGYVDDNWDSGTAGIYDLTTTTITVSKGRGYGATPVYWEVKGQGAQ